MSLFSNYRTDANLETDGVTFELSGNRVTLARAGGENLEFQKLLTKLTQPYRRQIAQGGMDPKEEVRILRRVYAETVVKNWEVKVGEAWTQGIENEDGGCDPFTADNVDKILEKLPDLFVELQSLATTTTHYRAEVRASSLGN